MVENDKLSNSTMSLGDHLEELRTRLILAILGLAVGVIVCLIFGTKIIKFIEKPYFDVMRKRLAESDTTIDESEHVVLMNKFFSNVAARLESDPNAPLLDKASVDYLAKVFSQTTDQYKKELAGSSGDKKLPHWARLQTLAPPEAFVSYMKVSMISGLILTCPWVFYQIWMFVASGLYSHERLYVKKAIPFSAILFILGALFFLFVVSKLSLKFFLMFGDIMNIASNWTLQKYVSFVTILMLVFGIAFQTPIAIFILNRVGMVSVRSLRKSRKYVFLGMFVIAAVVTPPDVISQVTLGVPLYLLYELGILLCVIAAKKRAKQSDA